MPIKIDPKSILGADPRGSTRSGPTVRWKKLLKLYVNNNLYSH